VKNQVLHNDEIEQLMEEKPGILDAKALFVEMQYESGLVLAFSCN
jgi:hypothetical protein